MAVGGMIFGDFRVTITGDELHAVARGEPVDQKRHHPACEIKGATYTELRVAQTEDGLWMARCVVDV
jgi:SHS2 domain-containing protein